MKTKQLLTALALLMLGTLAHGATIQVINGITYSLDPDSKTAYVYSKNESNTNIGSNYSISTAIIPPSVTYDGKSYTVNKIGKRAFVYYYNTSYGQNSTLKAVSAAESVTEIGNSAFWYCIGLTRVAIPGVQKIGNEAFYQCSSLSDIVLPETLTELGTDAFRGCGLKEVTIPESLTVISNGAFAANTKLTKVTIPATVTDLGENVFNGCSAMTTITLPKSIQKIDYRAFYGMSGLTEFHVKMMNPDALEYGSDLFTGINKDKCTLYVPEGTLAKYRNSFVWYEFDNIEEEPLDDDQEPIDDDPLRGDVNRDGVVNAADVTSLYNILLK